MEFYISGCFVAFVLSIISLISKLIEKYSQISKNFEKIGFYYRVSSGKYELKELPKGKEILSIIGSLLLNVIFSRISVVVFIYGWIKGLIEKSRLPDKMKEINFKLKHKNLDKDEMLAVWNEGNEYLGYDEWSYYYKEDDAAEVVDGVRMVYDLNLGEGARVDSVHVSPNVNRIFRMQGSFGGSKNRAFEYRITGRKLLVKCMQYDVKTTNNNFEYAIKNGKINETLLKQWYASGDKEQTEEEYIKTFQELCDWHILKSIRVTAFVFATEQDMKKESEKMKKEDFNALIDSKISDLEKCGKELDELNKKHKSLKDIKDWNNLNKSQQKEYTEYRIEFNKIEEKYGYSDSDECYYREQIIDELNSYKL